MGFDRSFLHLMRPIFGIDSGTIESSTIPTGEEAMHLRQSCGTHRADKVELGLGGAWMKTSGKNFLQRADGEVVAVGLLLDDSLLSLRRLTVDCTLLPDRMRHQLPPSTDLPQAAVEALWKGNVIEAIKIVRLERDVELKAAKDQVDAYLKGQPALQHRLEAAQAQATQTLVWWLIGLLMLAAAAAYVYVSGS